MIVINIRLVPVYLVCVFWVKWYCNVCTCIWGYKSWKLRQLSRLWSQLDEVTSQTFSRLLRKNSLITALILLFPQLIDCLFLLTASKINEFLGHVVTWAQYFAYQVEKRLFTLLQRGGRRTNCAKLHASNSRTCINHS